MPDGPFSFDKTGHNNFRLGAIVGARAQEKALESKEGTSVRSSTNYRVIVGRRLACPILRTSFHMVK